MPVVAACYWRETIDRLGLKVLEVVYEDLSANTTGTLARVFDWLDIPIRPDELPQPRTKKLPNEVNRELRQGYLAVKGEDA